MNESNDIELRALMRVEMVGKGLGDENCLKKNRYLVPSYLG